jgi:hypothetical protein
MVLNSWPMNPSGVQFAMPIFPPGRQTRSISAAARSWSAVNNTPKVDMTASKVASGQGRASGVLVPHLGVRQPNSRRVGECAVPLDHRDPRFREKLLRGQRRRPGSRAHVQDAARLERR